MISVEREIVSRVTNSFPIMYSGQKINFDNIGLKRRSYTSTPPHVLFKARVCLEDLSKWLFPLKYRHRFQKRAIKLCNLHKKWVSSELLSEYGNRQDTCTATLQLSSAEADTDAASASRWLCHFLHQTQFTHSGFFKLRPRYFLQVSRNPWNWLGLSCLLGRKVYDLLKETGERGDLGKFGSKRRLNFYQQKSHVCQKPNLGYIYKRFFGFSWDCLHASRPHRSCTPAGSCFDLL